MTDEITKHWAGLGLEMLAERHRQIDKFGEQHEIDHGLWNSILAQEVGEVSTALIKGPGITVDLNNLEEELIQVATVCGAWLEKVRAEKAIEAEANNAAYRKDQSMK